MIGGPNYSSDRCDSLRSYSSDCARKVPSSAGSTLLIHHNVIHFMPLKTQWVLSRLLLLAGFTAALRCSTLDSIASTFRSITDSVRQPRGGIPNRLPHPADYSKISIGLGAGAEDLPAPPTVSVTPPTVLPRVSRMPCQSSAGPLPGRGCRKE